MVELCMTRRLGEQHASVSLPDAYSVRWYRPGDRETWQRIQASTGIYDPIAPDLFDREFGEAAELLPQRQCFVEDPTGLAVGTATGWIPAAGRDSREGRLHWVAVSPGHQRRGLGRYLTETACARLRELGTASAYLTTGSQNVAAVQLYLGLGFRPQPRSAEELSAWQSVADSLEPRFKAWLEGLAT